MVLKYIKFLNFGGNRISKRRFPIMNFFFKSFFEKTISTFFFLFLKIDDFIFFFIGKSSLQETIFNSIFWKSSFQQTISEWLLYKYIYIHRHPGQGHMQMNKWIMPWFKTKKRVRNQTRYPTKKFKERTKKLVSS